MPVGTDALRHLHTMLMWYRIIRFLQDYFSVSPGEARGLFGLLLLSAFFLAFPALLRGYLFNRPHPETVEERQFVDSLVRTLSVRREYRRPAERQGDAPTAELKAFNPNTASAEELAALGIPGFLARRILNYRSKGGVFRKKEDLRRIYDFPDTLYARLEPYIVLAGAPEEKRSVAVERQETGSRPVKEETWKKVGREDAGSYAAAGERAVIVPFDINKADTSQLKRLKGIGPVRARTIVAYRKALGGFYTESQFPEIYGMDSVALSQLMLYARILTPPEKIRINEISLEDLLRHPYARKNRKLSGAVIRYRDQHGAFRSREDLEKVVPVTPGFLDPLMPYIAF